MKVTIYRAIDDAVINVRYTDEIGEANAMTDDEIDAMECELKRVGRYWIDACTYCRKAD